MLEGLDRVFLTHSADRLEQYRGRIGDCLDRLNQDQIWARGCDNENAVGNLVLHLCGNVRQWIGTGVAGKPDVRVRDREFSARGDIQAEELKQRLETSVAEAAEVIRHLAPEKLAGRTRVQKYDLTVLEAIYHVVEHFAQHTGQIIFATKALTGQDLGFYAHLNQPSHGERTP